MGFSSKAKPAHPFHELPERQQLACSLRYCSQGPVLSYREIAYCMGITAPAAFGLVSRGTRRIRANGFDIADLCERALKRKTA